MVNPNRFYTYAYLREDRTPYYIGKGTGNRAYSQLNHNVSVPSKDKVLILKSKLSNEDANKHEKYMISVLGRKNNNTGILRNLTDGGEGVSGFKHTEENKKKMRKPNTDEHNKKVSEAIKRKWENGEYNKDEWKKRNLGKKQSEETILKKIKSMKKYYKTNKKVISEETRKKIVASWKEKYRSGQMKRAATSPNFSAKWWNNGQINTRSLECPGVEWKSGRINSKSTKGYKWWNNGQINTRSLECPGVEWKIGKLNKIALT
jgi:hypothetical protein